LRSTHDHDHVFYPSSFILFKITTTNTAVVRTRPRHLSRTYPYPFSFILYTNTAVVRPRPRFLIHQLSYFRFHPFPYRDHVFFFRAYPLSFLPYPFKSHDHVLFTTKHVHASCQYTAKFSKLTAIRRVTAPELNDLNGAERLNDWDDSNRHRYWRSL